MTTTHNPPPPSRPGSRRVVVAALAVAAVGVIVLVALAALGLGLFVVAAPVQSESPPVTVEETAVLADGQTFAFVTEVGDTFITVDPAELLTGEQARDAAAGDGVIAPGDDLPNDFYVDNPATETSRLEMVTGAEVTVLTFDSSGGITEASITPSDLAVAFTGADAGVPIYGLAAGQFPVLVEVDDGAVRAIQQVYLP